MPERKATMIDERVARGIVQRLHDKLDTFSELEALDVASAITTIERLLDERSEKDGRDADMSRQLIAEIEELQSELRVWKKAHADVVAISEMRQAEIDRLRPRSFPGA